MRTTALVTWRPAFRIRPWTYRMSENVLCRINAAFNNRNEKPIESCQMFGGQDKRSLLGAFFCDLNCEHISPDDRLLLCQAGRDENDGVTINYLEIGRHDRSLVFNTYVEAAGGYQDIICRRASGKNIKLSIRPEANSRGIYGRVRFMVYDADIPDFYEAMFVRTYALPSPQSIDRVAMILEPSGGPGGDYRPCGIPVGVNNFRAYGTGSMPELLKPNFEWLGGKDARIASRHYEGYKLNVLANLKQWKEHK